MRALHRFSFQGALSAAGYSVDRRRSRHWPRCCGRARGFSPWLWKSMASLGNDQTQNGGSGWWYTKVSWDYYSREKKTCSQSTNQGFSNSYVSLLGCAPWCSRNVLLHWPPARCECSISKPIAHPKSNHILIRQLELGFASEAPNKHLKHSALFRIRRQGVSW